MLIKLYIMVVGGDIRYGSPTGLRVCCLLFVLLVWRIMMMITTDLRGTAICVSSRPTKALRHHEAHSTLDMIQKM